METFIGLVTLGLILLALFSAFFMLIVQPIWAIIDVAVSDEQSGSTRVAVILLSLFLLGPLMTFIYACWISTSRDLRRSTIGGLIVLLLAGAGAFGGASSLKNTKSRLPELLGGVQPAGKGGQQQAAEGEKKGGLPIAGREQAAADIPLVSPAEVEMPKFTAINYVPLSERKWTVSVADFAAGGSMSENSIAVEPPSIYPVNQLAVDPRGPVYYAISTHKLGRIIPSTGKFVEIKLDPAVAELSWPAALAFDTDKRLLVVTARSGAYTYDPETGEWKTHEGFGSVEFYSLVYDPQDKIYYGLVFEFAKDTVDTIVKLNSDGAVVSSIELSSPIAADSLPRGRVQLAKPGRELVILVSAHYKRGGPGGQKKTPAKVYVVDPGTGTIALVEEKPEEDGAEEEAPVGEEARGAKTSPPARQNAG